MGTAEDRGRFFDEQRGRELPLSDENARRAHEEQGGKVKYILWSAQIKEATPLMTIFESPRF